MRTQTPQNHVFLFVFVVATTTMLACIGTILEGNFGAGVFGIALSLFAICAAHLVFPDDRTPTHDAWKGGDFTLIEPEHQEAHGVKANRYDVSGTLIVDFGDEPTIQQVADHVGLPAHEVADALNEVNHYSETRDEPYKLRTASSVIGCGQAQWLVSRFKPVYRTSIA